MDSIILHGVVQGDTIKLTEASGLVDGQPVTIEVRPDVPGDGIRASAGAWADAGEEVSKWLSDVYEARTMGRSRAD